MRRVFIFVVSLLLSLHVSAGVNASEFGSKDEAVALVKKAIAYTAQVGIDKVVVEFSDPTGKWVDRDLYLILVDKSGNRIAHGQNKKMIGKSYTESIDVTGKAYGKEVMEAAATKTSGWTDYYFTDPISKKQMPKSAYWEKSDGHLFICGVYLR